MIGITALMNNLERPQGEVAMIGAKQGFPRALARRLARGIPGELDQGLGWGLPVALRWAIVGGLPSVISMALLGGYHLGLLGVGLIGFLVDLGWSLFILILLGPIVH